MKNKLIASLVYTIVGAAAAHAMPVLNLSEGVNDLVTVYPDHQDKNLYYIAPSVFEVSRERDGLPRFSYVEFKDCLLCKTQALVQSTMIGTLNGDDFLKRAMDLMQKRNPHAKFAPLPIESSSVDMADSLGKMIVESDCEHPAGVLGSEQICTFILNSRGRKAFRQLLKEALTITLNYQYTVDGVRLGADGRYVDAKTTHIVAGRIGGPMLRKYPQLFRDKNGDQIESEDEATPPKDGG